MCDKQRSCVAFTYSIHDGTTCRRFMTNNSNLNVILQPSELELTFVKSEIDNSIIDQSKAPSSIIVDIPFKTHWAEENLNGIYQRITDKLYEKPALYSPTTNITLEYSELIWTFKNDKDVSNNTALAYTNSSVSHPGLLQFENATWNVLALEDSLDLKTFPYADNSFSYLLLNNRNVFQLKSLD